MPEPFKKIRDWLVWLTEFGLLLVAMAVILQLLFGDEALFARNVVQNLIALVNALGQQGFVGLLALAVILWLFWRRTPR